MASLSTYASPDMTILADKHSVSVIVLIGAVIPAAHEPIKRGVKNLLIRMFIESQPDYRSESVRYEFWDRFGTKVPMCK